MMLRLCESEGRFDFGAYDALHTRVSWTEAQRISTAMVVIGDERSDFSTWYSKHGQKIAEALERNTPDAASGNPSHTVSIDTLRSELDATREGIEFASSKIVAHRQALLAGKSEGQLSSSQLGVAERLLADYKDQEARLVASIMQMASDGQNTDPPLAV